MTPNRYAILSWSLALAFLVRPSLAGAQSSRIPDLVLDVSPTGTDELIVHKSGDTRAKKTTRADLRLGLSGVGACSAGQFVSTLNSDAAPTCSAVGSHAHAASDITSGTVATARGGTNLDTSAATGVLRVSSGTWGADAGISHLASSTSGALAGVLSDEVGTGAVVLAASPTFTGTPSVPTAAADTSTTQAASTAFVQQELGGAGGRSLTCASGSCDADAELYELSKGLVVENPLAGDDFILYRAERALTITGIDCIVVGGTSVSVTVKECDASGASCGNSEAAITCGTTNTTEASGVDDAAVDAGDYLRVDPGTVTGAVTQLFVQVTFQVAD